jgi:hypothetical protein
MPKTEQLAEELEGFVDRHISSVATAARKERV